MKKILLVIAVIISFLPKSNSQSTQNILGVSFIHRSTPFLNNSNGVGINIERYHSKIKYLSYGINAEYFGPSKYVNFNYSSPPDQFSVFSTSTFKLGGRLALHLQKGKFDFYAGGQLSFVNDNYHFFDKVSQDSPSVYNPFGYGGYGYGSNTIYHDKRYNSLLFEPFIGLRFHPIKNLGIQIEGSQRKTSVGLNVKF